MNFLELVNQVMIRLREPEVVSVTNSKYTKLIAAFVNDAKRAVEDAAHWTQLRNALPLTSAAGSAVYNLENSNERTTVLDVFDSETDRFLKRISDREWTHKFRESGDQQTRPTEWAITGYNNFQDQLKVALYPTPSEERTYICDVIVPRPDLTNNTDSISVPSEPVFLRAYAYAIKERGEDNGVAYREALDQARKSLSRYLVLNGHNTGPKVWQVR